MRGLAVARLIRTKMNPTKHRPFHCTYCPKSFRLSQHLKEHIRIHTGEKPYKCDVCGHAFCQISNLKSHQKTHTKVKGFRCDVCRKEFRRSFTLKQHRLTHTKPANCETESRRLEISRGLTASVRTGNNSPVENAAEITKLAKRKSETHLEKHSDCFQQSSFSAIRPSLYSRDSKLHSNSKSRSVSTYNIEDSISPEGGMTQALPPLLPFWNTIYGEERLQTNSALPFQATFGYDVMSRYARIPETKGISLQHRPSETTSENSNPFISSSPCKTEECVAHRLGSESFLSNNESPQQTALDMATKKSPAKMKRQENFKKQVTGRSEMHMSLSDDEKFSKLDVEVAPPRSASSEIAYPHGRACSSHDEIIATKTPTIISHPESTCTCDVIQSKELSPNSARKWKAQYCAEWGKSSSVEETTKTPKSTNPHVVGGKSTKTTKSKPNSTSFTKSPSRTTLFAQKESFYSSSYEDDVFSPNSLSSSLSSTSHNASKTPEGTFLQPSSGKHRANDLSTVFHYSSLLAAKRARTCSEIKQKDTAEIARTTFNFPNPPLSQTDKHTLKQSDISKLQRQTISPEQICKERYPSPVQITMPNSLPLFEKSFLNVKNKIDNFSIFPTELPLDYTLTSLMGGRSTNISLNSNSELKSLSGHFSFVPMVTWKPVVTGWRNLLDGHVYPVHP